MEDSQDTFVETVTENGVNIEIPKCKKQAGILKYYNSKLALQREAVLATLKLESTSSDKPLVCLDASTGSGISGLQWKKHCTSNVHVVAACTETDAIKRNSALTDITCSDWLLDPCHVTGQWPIKDQTDSEIHVSPYHPNTVLRHVAFNFIFIHPTTSLALYTDSVFANIRQNGVSCFLCPNITSQCFRSPDLVLRQFGSHVQKTEYVKELAIRVVISDIARAAARYQKGVEVLYTLCLDDHFLIVTRTTKSHQQAVCSVEQCRQVLHCRICEERVVYPQTNSPIENPYSLLPCDCNTSNPGKTAVILGPIWTGRIYNVSYLHKLWTQVHSSNEKGKLCSMLQTLLLEANCRSEGEDGMTVSLNTVRKCKQCGNKSQNGAGEPAEKKQKLDNETVDNKVLIDCSQCDSCTCGVNGSKQTSCDMTVNNTETKQEDMPLFYYDLQKKKYSGFPKLDRVITMLRAAGYRASRTHFEHQAIRTSANARQLNELMIKLVKK